MVSISESLCSGCLSLTIVHLPNVVLIGRKAFLGCGLETIFLPKSLEQVQALAFANRAALSTMQLPEKAVINEDSFESCDTLQSLCESSESLADWLKHRYDSLPLHRLSYSSSISVDAILSCDTEIWADATDVWKSNPLHLLGQNAHVTDHLIRAVLSRSRNQTMLLLCEDKKGRTPLHCLCRNRHVGLPALRVVVDRGDCGSFCTTDRHGKCTTALAIGCSQPIDIQSFLYKFRPGRTSGVKI
mmetsp:Transcript_24821/g.68735  ORF Transcript_24821/g.68735 Transcript_24821/m.68735 type:complete len:244 (+) Transcript_24821:1342-2073(+)